MNRSRTDTFQQQTQSSASAGPGAWSSASAQSQVGWQSHSPSLATGFLEVVLALLKRILSS